jgi:hypothetical protein
MAASSRLMITEAERRFPVRIKLALPPGGLGKRLGEMHAWLDENCGADVWAMTPSGLASAEWSTTLPRSTSSIRRPRRVLLRAGAPVRSLRPPTGRSGSARIRQRRELVWQHTGRFDRIGLWTTCNRCRRRPTTPVWVLARSEIPFGNLVRAKRFSPLRDRRNGNGGPENRKNLRWAPDLAEKGWGL